MVSRLNKANITTRKKWLIFLIKKFLNVASLNHCYEFHFAFQYSFRLIYTILFFYSNCSEHGTHCSGSIPTLQNTPNNKRPSPIQSNNSSRVISPQNSIKSVSLSHYLENGASTPVPNGQAPCSRRNSSIPSQNTLSPSNTCYIPSRQMSISGKYCFL